MNKSKIEVLQQTGRTVFNTDDLCIFWRNPNRDQTSDRARDYVRRGRLFRISRGLYTLQKPSQLEIAQKLLTPSYISFYTALTYHGLIFQDYGPQIHSIALDSITKKINNTEFIYHQFKPEIFYNQLGIEKHPTFNLASPERAVADSLYLNKNLAFDNLRSLNFEFLQKISTIYQQKSLTKAINDLIKNHAR